MFGYVRPYRDELKVRDYELYRAVYCGLCHSLKRRCGPAGRFLINYDFTFLALLLSHGEEDCRVCAKKCLVSPLKGRKACVSVGEGGSAILDDCADLGVILSWWKLRDGIEDEGFFKSLILRFAALFLKGAYKKAAANKPAFAENCRLRIKELGELEAARCASLDETSDKFALILSEAAKAAKEAAVQRSLWQLLYQLGKLIYLLDAYGDREEDGTRGRYNPITAKYGAEPDGGELEMLLRHSLGFISSAYELLDKGVFAPLLENTVYLGLPSVVKAALEGRFRNGLIRGWEPKL